MPIHIVVDGYNVIGSEEGLRGDLEQKRADLVQEVKQYQERKGHAVTIVFDGWRNGRQDQTQDQVGEVQVVFSRHGEKADAVIERMAREIVDGCTVITSDRELRRSVEKRGAVALYVNDFLGAMRRDPGASDGMDDTGEFEAPPRNLNGQKKKGNPRQPSRAERARRERLAKL